MSVEKEIGNNSIPIGKEVTIFRTLLNCTQQEFADLLLLSRASINKLERSQDINTLSPDIAFRLYYITQLIINNDSKEDYIKSHAKELQSRIDNALRNRISA